MKTKKQKHGSQHFENEEILHREEQFIGYYAGDNAAGQRTLRLLLRLYRGHYRKLLLAVLFHVLKTSPAWIIPIVTKNVINLATDRPADAAGQMLINFICIIFLLLLNIPTHMIYIRLNSLARRSVEAGLRGAIVRKLQQISITFYKEMQSGRIQSKIMRDVENVETFSNQLFETVLNMLVYLTVSLGVILYTNWRVFLFVIVCAPVASLTVVAFHNNMRNKNREFRKEIEHTSASVMDMVELIPVTRAHALEQEEVNKVTEQLNLVAERGYRLDMVQSLFGSVSWVVFNLFQIICLFTTGYLAYLGKISIGEIALYQSYFTTIVNQISALIGLLPILAKGSESLNSIGEILSANDVEDNSGKKRLKDLRGEYEFRDVVFGYDADKPVLNHLNLKVKAGETVALVGESGAGKSTVLNMVIGFHLATSGQVLIDGCDIKELDLHNYRTNIAVVPQTSILFSGTIRDNITYGMPNVSEAQLQQAIAAANLTSFILSLPDGLDTVVGEHGGKLSGGQRQRISIARAIIRNPKVILFDEATSALDSISEREIQTAINNLTRDRTTFIVAHRLSTIRDADKIAVLRDGKCVEFGTYEELMALQGEFYTMKQLQS